MHLTPQQPTRADHRIIHKILDQTGKGKVVYIPAEFSRVSEVFVGYGGSWKRLHQGSVEEMVRLKRVIQVGVKHGYLTPKGDW